MTDSEKFIKWLEDFNLDERKAGLEEKIENEISELMSGDTDAEQILENIRKTFKDFAGSVKKFVLSAASCALVNAQIELFKKRGIEYYTNMAVRDNRTCSKCTDMNGRTFRVEEAKVGFNAPAFHWFCRCIIVAGANSTTVDTRKFSEYIFKDGAAPGKDVVYKNLGYSAKDSELLTKIYHEQGAAKYASGNYTLGKLDAFGQRINIEIELPGIGAATGKTGYVNSGWMIKPDGSISLNTPFSGFTK